MYLSLLSLTRAHRHNSFAIREFFHESTFKAWQRNAATAQASSSSSTSLALSTRTFAYRPHCTIVQCATSSIQLRKWSCLVASLTPNNSSACCVLLPRSVWSTWRDKLTRLPQIPTTWLCRHWSYYQPIHARRVTSNGTSLNVLTVHLVQSDLPPYRSFSSASRHKSASAHQRNKIRRIKQKCSTSDSSPSPARCIT